jgi:hypothetical protein
VALTSETTPSGKQSLVMEIDAGKRQRRRIRDRSSHCIRQQCHISNFELSAVIMYLTSQPMAIGERARWLIPRRSVSLTER